MGEREITKSASSQSLDSLLNSNFINDMDTNTDDIDDLSQDVAKESQSGDKSPKHKPKKPRTGTGSKSNKDPSQTTISFRKPSPVTNDTQMISTTELNKRLESLQTKYDTKFKSMETLIKQLSDENKNLKSEITRLGTDNVKVTEKLTNFDLKLEKTNQESFYANYKANVAVDKIDELEQHGRSNTIRVYGVKDTNQNETTAQTATEVINLLENELDMTIERGDIDIAHRLGIFDINPDKNRSIICKFVRRTVKHEVIKRRRMLVGKAQVIVEDLTQENRELLTKTFEKDNISQAWSSNGKIFGKNKETGQILRFEKEIKSCIKNFEKKLYGKMTLDPPNDRESDDINSFYNEGFIPARRDRSHGKNIRGYSTQSYRSRGKNSWGRRSEGYM